MRDPDVAKHQPEPRRLANFIRANVAPIVAEWVKFAQTRTPASDEMTDLALKDHIVELLKFIADDLESPQSRNEQVRKSRGLEAEGKFTRSAAEIHASLRWSDGFNIDQMVSEYRALRASVVKLWTASTQVLPATDLEDMTRFNEAIDQAMTESVAEYTKMVNQSRDLFLGVLGHDLRNPIGAALMAAQRMVNHGAAGSKESLFSGQIAKSMTRAISILDDLLEVTRSAFGSELPLVRTSMKMSELGTELVEEMRTLSGGRQIEITLAGDTEGEWDRPKMGQVFSNLIGNALQYSPHDSIVSVAVSDEEDRVMISVHNDGDPISLDQQKTIFNFLTRGKENGSEGSGSTHLGLGLFISHKIVVAHGGKISVESTQELGTTFSAVLPKRRVDYS
ncbi:ATP-binding protein [Neorhizobium sp. DT-125]|uniref:ATP-binding protein n=1 Tax=Neorhizobium sp. DT-125 TaxID=3396163 RepID=UPI003F1A8CCD